MPLPRVYVDFHNLDEFNCIRLTCTGTIADLERLGIRLHEGLALRLYTDDADDNGNPDDLFADAIVQFNKEEQCWVAAIDWRALHHASENTLLNGQVTGSHEKKAIPSA